MSVQAILTADNHLDPTAVNFGPNRFQRRRDHLQCFEEAVEYAKKERPDLFFMGGDVFDSIRPSNATRATVMNLFRSLHMSGIRIFVVSGHHDTPKSIEEGVSPLAVYGNSGYVHFFRNPSEPEAVILDIKGTKVSLVGISHNPLHGPGEDPLSNLSLKPEGQFNILLTHYPIQGFGGWIGDEPVIRPSSIPEVFQLVVVGHFHNYQTKKVGRTEIIYPGSTERVSFTEESEDKGFVWLEFDDKDVTLKEFVKTHARPHKTLRVEFPTGRNPVDKIKEEVKKLFDPELVLRIRLHGKVTVDNLASYRRPEILSACQGKVFHCFVEEDELTIQSPEVSEPLPRTTPLQELERYFRQLIKDANPEEKTILQKALEISQTRLQEAGAW